jgi:SAM-dependent methyltransferase
MRMKMYDELAAWWPLLSKPEDYAEEAAFYARAMRNAATGPLRTVLELGSGGGNNASHMKVDWQLTLVDPSGGMRRVSEALNPECEHLAGDMRTVRLGRQFDGVFVHDAVAYMTTLDDLCLAIQTAFLHTRPGGVALFAPDYVRENFRAGTECGGDDDGPRGLRYLEWVWDPNPADAVYNVDYVIAYRTDDGVLHVEPDRHTEGLFSRQDWLRVLTEAGYQPRVVPLEHSALEPGAHEVFVACRPE